MLLRNLLAVALPPLFVSSTLAQDVAKTSTGHQLFEADNGDISVSNFSGVNGIGVYDSNGTFLRKGYKVWVTN